MKQEIRFRGKQATWEYGGYANCFEQHLIINENGSFTVDGETVGQFTGFNTKMGEELFSGDIVKIIWPPFEGQAGEIEEIGVVEMEEGCFCINGTPLYIMIEFIWGIIGNTTDNPDLLK